MKQLFIFALPAFFMIACSENNDNQKPLSNDLVQLENDWMHAMMKRQQPMLDQLVAPEFTVTGMKYIDSPAVTRNVWMYNTMNNMKIDSVHFIKTKMTIVDDVGIVKAQFYWSGAYDEDRFEDSVSLVDTWIKRNRGWQVVSRIITD